MSEIIQPSIEKPDLGKPFSWASLARVHSHWLREVAPQLNLDVEKIIIGDVLSSIIGDDYGVLGPEIIILSDPDDGEMSRRMLLERLDWEGNTPEMPEDIRLSIHAVHQTIEKSEWSTERSFRTAKNTWLDFKEGIKGRINTDSQLQEALDYSNEQSDTLSPYWQIFLFGEVKY